MLNRPRASRSQVTPRDWVNQMILVIFGYCAPPTIPWAYLELSLHVGATQPRSNRRNVQLRWLCEFPFGYVRSRLVIWGPGSICGAHRLILVSVGAPHHPLMLAGAWVARGDTTAPPKPLHCRHSAARCIG